MIKPDIVRLQPDLRRGNDKNPCRHLFSSENKASSVGTPYPEFPISGKGKPGRPNPNRLKIVADADWGRSSAPATMSRVQDSILILGIRGNGYRVNTVINMAAALSVGVLSTAYGFFATGIANSPAIFRSTQSGACRCTAGDVL